MPTLSPAQWTEGVLQGVLVYLLIALVRQKAVGPLRPLGASPRATAFLLWLTLNLVLALITVFLEALVELPSMPDQPPREAGSSPADSPVTRIPGTALWRVPQGYPADVLPPVGSSGLCPVVDAAVSVGISKSSLLRSCSTLPPGWSSAPHTFSAVPRAENLADALALDRRTETLDALLQSILWTGTDGRKQNRLGVGFGLALGLARATAFAASAWSCRDPHRDIDSQAHQFLADRLPRQIRTAGISALFYPAVHPREKLLVDRDSQKLLTRRPAIRHAGCMTRNPQGFHFRVDKRCLYRV